MTKLNIPDVSTPCDRLVSTILQHYCDMIKYLSFCTFICDEALYSVVFSLSVIAVLSNFMMRFVLLRSRLTYEGFCQRTESDIFLFSPIYQFSNVLLLFVGSTFRLLQKRFYFRYLCTSIMCSVFVLVVSPVSMADVRLLPRD